MYLERILKQGHREVDENEPKHSALATIAKQGSKMSWTVKE